MNRFSLAIRCFFGILFSGEISDSALGALRLVRRTAAAPPPKPAASPAAPTAPPAPVSKASDGAVQILAILQRDSRLVDFLMEDVTSYSDEQIGSAVRDLHDQARASISRHVKLEPVVDGVEGTYAKAPSAGLAKFVGNVPVKPPEGGILRHKGWRAAKVDLPAPARGQDASVVAPAEIEIE